jgi:hypothetical protein
MAFSKLSIKAGTRIPGWRIRNGTVTAAGLRVTACLKRGGNETAECVSDDDMRRLHLTLHTVCPAWNHTLSPRTVWADE